MKKLTDIYCEDSQLTYWDYIQQCKDSGQPTAMMETLKELDGDALIGAFKIAISDWGAVDYRTLKIQEYIVKRLGK